MTLLTCAGTIVAWIVSRRGSRRERGGVGICLAIDLSGHKIVRSPDDLAVRGEDHDTLVCQSDHSLTGWTLQSLCRPIRLGPDPFASRVNFADTKSARNPDVFVHIPGHRV
jgi:hypothetical protein